MRRLTQDPARPYVVVLGGSKVSDKLGVIDNLLDKADALLIGGGMVFTFLAAEGHEVGKSLLEEDQIQTCQDYLSRAEKSGVRIVLPTDIVIDTAFPSADREPDAAGRGCRGDPCRRARSRHRSRRPAVPSPRSSPAPRQCSGTARWGSSRRPEFADGTRAVAEALTQVTAKGGLSVVGGGDSAAAVRILGFSDDAFGHISTGGGASLEFLEGKTLPGLTVLAKD